MLQLPPTVLTGGAVILSRGEGRQCRRVAAWSPSGASTQDLLHSPSDGDDASSGIASSGNSGAVCKMIGRNYGMGVVVWFYELFVVARAVVAAAWRSQAKSFSGFLQSEICKALASFEKRACGAALLFRDRFLSIRSGALFR